MRLIAPEKASRWMIILSLKTEFEVYLGTFLFSTESWTFSGQYEFPIFTVSLELIKNRSVPLSHLFYVHTHLAAGLTKTGSEKCE